MKLGRLSAAAHPLFIEADAAGGKAPAGSPGDRMNPKGRLGAVARQMPEIHGLRLDGGRDRTIYPQTPGLVSNGEDRRERDGLYPERLAVYQRRDGADWMPVPENGRGIIHGRAVALTPNTGYEPAEDNRQVTSPTVIR